MVISVILSDPKGLLRRAKDLLVDSSAFGLRMTLLLGILNFLGIYPSFAADDKSKSSTTQQVGGLLFEMDEGVKVEQGPGGSVYVKSNKEYMQEKLKTIDQRLEDIEKRLTLLESQKTADKKEKPSVSVSGPSVEVTPEEATAAASSSSGKRVLVT